MGTAAYIESLALSGMLAGTATSEIQTMRFEIDLNVNLNQPMSPELRGMLDKILHMLTRQGTIIMATLQDLQAKVAAQTTVEASAITLLQGLKAALDAAIASGDPVAMQAISDQLDANATALAAAVSANTPAEENNPGG